MYNGVGGLNLPKEVDVVKVQVNLSDELVARVDEYAKQMGVSRSALCGVWIGQAVISLDNALDISKNVFKDMLPKLSRPPVGKPNSK